KPKTSKNFLVLIGEKTVNYKHILIATSISLMSTSAFARNLNGCPVTHAQLQNALEAAQAQVNGQFTLDMWATVVTKNGRVCSVAKTGGDLTDQWLASRVISAQKAYTAASLSNNKGSSGSAAGQSVGFTSAGLYLAASPGGPLYGLQHSNPVDTKWAYSGNSRRFGTPRDPMIGRYVGGINVFGGGLPLFDENGQVIGGLGVSGNTSCADHNIAWRVRGDFAAQGIAQGADFEFGIDYAGGYPTCGDDGEPNSIDDTWEVIGIGGSSPIDQHF
ncbi:MAG: GlcG/HbpS family heme-binding protein, partial [Gammaproteobacteria bacterium]